MTIKDKKRRVGIQLKVTLAMAVSTFLILSVAILLGWFFGAKLLTGVIGNDYGKLADTVGMYTYQLLEREIESAHAVATRPLLRDFIEEANSKYGRMGGQDIERQLKDMDKAWIPALEDSPLLKEYLANRLSVSLKDFLREKKFIAEVFITDKYGGLVASSGKTSDFYQADELWWQEAYNNGAGDTYLGDVEFDDSSGLWVVPMAVPVKDRNGNVIGILKYTMSVDRLFKNLGLFKIGETGQVFLVNNKGDLLYGHNISPLSAKLYSEQEMKELLSKKRHYFISKKPRFHDRNALVVFSHIKEEFKNLDWWIFISQETREIYSPLSNFILIMLIIGIGCLILVVPASSFFGGLIAKPIHELHIATEEIMKGNWDYKLNIKTGDDIEQLAETFEQMFSDIKAKQGELLKSKEKVEAFSTSLEMKVAERTKELTESQEASLNILEDLQEAKEVLERTNRELMKLDQLKSDFISTVSHELRTPLSIIKEGISLVLDKIPGNINEKQEKILDVSKHNIDRLARIINSLLDISKIEAGKVELKKGLINMSELIRSIASTFEKKIGDKGLRLKLDVEEVSGKVYADSDRVSQVLTNLLDNAIKFTSKGEIRISCKDRKDSVECSVADTGSGISREDLPKVFDKFQQFGRLAGAGDKGTGLGLSIAKNIIDLHNGAMWVESDLGKGTKFTFTLHKYTEDTLFRDYIHSAIKRAEENNSKVSIIAISFKEAKDAQNLSPERREEIFLEASRLIKNTLHRKGDEIVRNGGEMIVILVDCNKENSLMAEKRIAQVLSKYFAEQKLDVILKPHFGYATYPDDANNEIDLMARVKR